MTSKDMNSAISLPELADGPLPLNGQDGKDKSGPAVVPVSRFRALGKDEAMPTNAISGPLFNNSSPSAALQWSLESRLRQNLAGSGCPLYELTWSQWDMPAGPQICRQRASARRTSGNGCTGWPSPKAGNSTGPGMHGDGGMDLQTTAQLTGWATPRSTEAGHSTGNPDRAIDKKSRLEDQVFLTGWATPTVRDHKDGAASLETNPINARLGMEVLLTGWPTPNAIEPEGPKGNPAQFSMARRTKEPGKTTSNLGRMVHFTGEMSNGSPAPTERRGQLNPEFTRWLMGFPAEWASCAPTGTR